VLAAFVGTRRVGGAVAIVDDPHVDLRDDHPALSLLWDLRVASDMRRQGIGAALLHAAESVSVRRGARELRVETQQVNVPACRFYQHHGFRLERSTRGVYLGLPGEIQLLWRKALRPTIE
jgi:ribosomal protein S18 acetylase RimI-like enzyme